MFCPDDIESRFDIGIDIIPSSVDVCPSAFLRHASIVDITVTAAAFGKCIYCIKSFGINNPFMSVFIYPFSKKHVSCGGHLRACIQGGINQFVCNPRHALVIEYKSDSFSFPVFLFRIRLYITFVLRSADTVIFPPAHWKTVVPLYLVLNTLDVLDILLTQS